VCVFVLYVTYMRKQFEYIIPAEKIQSSTFIEVSPFSYKVGSTNQLILLRVKHRKIRLRNNGKMYVIPVTDQIDFMIW